MTRSICARNQLFLLRASTRNYLTGYRVSATTEYRVIRQTFACNRIDFLFASQTPYMCSLGCASRKPNFEIHRSIQVNYYARRLPPTCNSPWTLNDAGFSLNTLLLPRQNFIVIRHTKVSFLFWFWIFDRFSRVLNSIDLWLIFKAYFFALCESLRY